MRSVVVLGVLGVLAGSAHADPIKTAEEVVDTVRRLDDTLNTVISIGYALSNPEQLAYLPSQIYGELLDEIDKDPVTKALFESMAEQYRHGFVRVSADAGVTSDRDTRIGATAAVDAAWELPLCKVLGVTAYGLAGYGDGERIGAYSLGGTACLPLPADTLQVSYTHRENVRTTLLSRPVVLLDRRQDDLVDVLLRFYRYIGPENVIDFFKIDVHVDVSRTEETTGFGTQDLVLDMGPVHWIRRGKGFLGGDQTYRFLDARVLYHNDENSPRLAVNFIIIPLAIDGIRLGDDAAMGAEVGVAQAAGRVEDGIIDPMTMQSGETDLVAKTDVHARGWLDFVIRPVVARLELSHTILPTFDAQFVAEDRVALQAQTVIGDYIGHVEGFVSRAHLYRENGGALAVLSGGAFDLSWALLDHVHLVGRVEGARAIEALTAIAPIEPRWDLRATIGVTAHFDRKW